MLLRFSVSNYLSVAEKQELSLVASRLRGAESSLFPVPGSDLKALPSAVIYGANASGKSNVIRALNLMRKVILYSHSQGNPEGGVPITPFELNPHFKSLPSAFEADFVIENVRYQYGFDCNKERFTGEWLYSYPEGKRRKVFERSGDEVEFGQTMKGPKKILVSLMRPNSLFLSTATQNDHEDLSRIVQFFRTFKYINQISVAKDLINHTFKEDDIDPRTISFLASIGTGVTNYRQTAVDVPDNVKSLQNEILSIVKRHVGETGPQDDIRGKFDKDFRIELAHRAVDGSDCYFNLERESSGTRRLLLMLSSVFKALDDGSLIVIDELDASLHTLATEQVLALFSNGEINLHGAQCICTTHDTNLLGSTYLRRDQIWFCEKASDGATSLYPLSDIRSRSTDDFEKGYLEGRYGAIPFSGNIRSVLLGLPA